jgi:DNA invertase Pin-like site-specific DNA recombinase
LTKTTADEERELRATAERMGCEIVHAYEDHTINGARDWETRPAFDELCRAAARCEFDLVVAWSIERLSRSLKDLVKSLFALHSLGIDLFVDQQGLDTTTASGGAIIRMVGIFDQ